MLGYGFNRIQIPGARTRRFLDSLLDYEWICLEKSLIALREGRREFYEGAGLPAGAYYLEACGFTIWFTAPELGRVATITQVRYQPDLPE